MPTNSSLGIDLKKEEIRWTLISGTIEAPAYLKHGRKKYNSSVSRNALQNSFYKIFIELLAEFDPQSVGYRVNHQINTVDQAAYLIMPLGLLCNLRFDKNIPTCEFNNNSFTAKRFGLSKGTQPAEHISKLFESPSPHWDQNQKYSAMTAWGALNV